MDPISFLVVLMFGLGGGYTYKNELVKAEAKGKASVVQPVGSK